MARENGASLRDEQAERCLLRVYLFGNNVSCAHISICHILLSFLCKSYPSTSPSFFPLAANSSASSTPTNVPFLPLTLPMNLTVPYMSPGTFTESPTPNSSPSILFPLAGVVGCWLKLRMLAFRAFREGEEVEFPRLGLCMLLPRPRCRGVWRAMSSTVAGSARDFRLKFSFRRKGGKQGASTGGWTREIVPVRR